MYGSISRKICEGPTIDMARSNFYRICAEIMRAHRPMIFWGGGGVGPGDDLLEMPRAASNELEQRATNEASAAEQIII
jgi:hypothetical protein